MSVGMALLLIRVLPAPANPGETLGWWATLGLSVIVFSIASERAFRTLLPVASLLEMTLAFPDQAPSRFNAALRSPSFRSLQKSVAEGTLDENQTPSEAAGQLLSMAQALSNHDRATRGHTERVRAYALIIGEEMGLKPNALEKLRWSALIHDVGKLRVRAEVLNASGRPSDAEWNELAQHPAHGADMAEPLRPWLGEWVDAAGQHHERWDGSGYPAGLKGEEISLSARIVAVADAYDVMTSARSYKPSFPIEEARAELARCAGQQFDPAVVKAMLNASIPHRRFGRLAASLAQIPILGASWPNSGVMVASSAAAVVAAVALTIGNFDPQLIAYNNLTAEEDNELSFAIQEEGSPVPDSVTILKVVGPATAAWDGALITITPDPDANGDVTVRYEACWDDECLIGEAATTFTAVNDDPVVRDDSETANGPGPITLRPLRNDSDVDNDELSIDAAEITSGDAGVEVARDALIVTPANDLPQTINLVYTVIDGVGGFATANARVIVPDFNAAPEAKNDEASVQVSKVVVVTVLSNDSDPADDPLTIISAKITEGATLGSVAIDGDTIVFSATERAGTAIVAYEISDGRATAGATLIISVTPPPPITSPDRLAINEDESGSIDVLANDSAPESELDRASVRIIDASLGTATSVGDGVIAFRSDPDAYGLGSVSYEVCNTFGLCSASYLFIEIARVNDLPRFSAGGDVSAASGSSYNDIWARNLSVGEDNEPSQSLSFTVRVANPDLFSVQPWIDPGGVLRFAAAPGAGATTASVVASDGVDSGPPSIFTITLG